MFIKNYSRVGFESLYEFANCFRVRKIIKKLLAIN